MARVPMNPPDDSRASPSAERALTPHRLASPWGSGVVLVLLLAGAAALRFWNIGAGLPERTGADEPVIAERAIHMMRTGDFNPHFFDYGGFYIYVQVLVGCLRFVIGAMDGLWRSLDAFQMQDLFLWTRALNAVLGAITVGVVYRAGLRWGAQVAVLAGVLMMVWPNHVRESHFALTDVPLTLLTALALLGSLRALDTGRLGAFMAAGACVGLAAATKYNGAVGLFMPLIAAVAAPPARQSRVISAVAVAGAAAAAFLAGAPYTVLDLPGFLNAFAEMAGSSYQSIPFGEGAALYMRHLRIAVGWPGLIVLGAGAVWGVMSALRGRDSARWGLLLVFPLLYFYLVATRRLMFARYLLPMLPFACLIMAVTLIGMVRWVWRLPRPLWIRSAVVAVILGGVLFYPVRAGIDWPRSYGELTVARGAQPPATARLAVTPAYSYLSARIGSTRDAR